MFNYIFTGRDSEADTWFIVKATNPYTRREVGGGRGERVIVTLQHCLR